MNPPIGTKEKFRRRGRNDDLAASFTDFFPRLVMSPRRRFRGAVSRKDAKARSLKRDLPSALDVDMTHPALSGTPLQEGIGFRMAGNKSPLREG